MRMMADNWRNRSEFLSRVEQDINHQELVQAFSKNNSGAQFLIVGQAPKIVFVFVFDPVSHLIGYWLAPDLRAQGRSVGYLAQSMQALERLRIRQVFAAVEGDNPASCKVLDKVGFKPLSLAQGVQTYVRYFNG